MAVVGVLVVWFLFWAALGGGIGLAIGHPKGHGGIGFVLGLLLGVIGWIIVAVMKPSEEMRRVQQAETIALAASMVGMTSEHASMAGTAPARERLCPWCAESIKAAARVCRFCGRDIEPLARDQSEVDLTSDSGASEAAIFDAIRAEYPDQYDDAWRWLQQLSVPPVRPVAWLRELCKRISAGSPMEAAAARIPLDWDGPVPVLESPPMPHVVAPGDPSDAGDFSNIQARHPVSYDRGRSMLAGLTEPPTNPQAWLEELCERIDQGSPPPAAAARIPLDWRGRSSAWHGPY
jgi:hypothetical protein